MLAITIVSVALSSIVALAAIGAQVWQEQKRRDHERGIADRASVQDVLSKTVAVLHRAEYAIDDAHLALLQWGAKMFDNEHPDRAAPFSTLEGVGREYDAVLGEVSIRLGPTHPATRSLVLANHAFLDGFRALAAIRREDPDVEGSYAEAEVVEAVASERDRLKQARHDFRSAQAEFIDRAYNAAGAKLPPSSK